MRRVVVTGIGMCSPLGYGVEHSWSQLVNSNSGISQLSGFDITGLSSQVGGQISKEGNSEFFPEKVIEIKKDMEAGDETTFLSSSLRPAFVEALAEKLRDAEADLQGEIEVRV